MKRTRRIFLVAWAVAGSVLAGATACSTSGGDKVGYSTASQEDQYRRTMTSYVEDDVKAKGLTLLPPADAQDQPDKQITDFTTLLGEGVDGILTVMQDSKAIRPALDRAAAKKVPVVAIDQGPAPGSGKVAMVVRGDPEDMGRQACQQLATRMKGRGTVLELQGDLTGVVGLQRSSGFRSCMRHYPKIVVVSKPTNWRAETAADVTRTELSLKPQIGGIFLASDAAMLSSVVKVLGDRKRLVAQGKKGHVSLVSIDGSPDALKAVRHGILDAVIAQPLSDYAKVAVDYLVAVIHGKVLRPGKSGHGTTIVCDDGKASHPEKSGQGTGAVCDGNLADPLPVTVVTKKNVSSPRLWGNAGRG